MNKVNKETVITALKDLKNQIKASYKIPLNRIEIQIDSIKINECISRGIVAGNYYVTDKKDTDSLICEATIKGFPGNCGYMIIHHIITYYKEDDMNEAVFKALLGFLITMLKCVNSNSIIYTNTSSFDFWPLFTEFGFKEINKMHNKNSGNTIIMVIKKL